MGLCSRRSHLGFVGPGWGRTAAAFVLALALPAIAGRPALAQAQAAALPVTSDAKPISDPWERANRASFAFSMSVDHAVIAPVAQGYLRVAPRPVETALGNLVHNLDEPRIAGNDLLQGHFERASFALGRFVLNSSVGIGGLFDPATRWGVPRHESDFGQTLGRYGLGTGPYIFVPFIGPSDLRDGVGRIADALGDPVAWATGGLNTPFGWSRAGATVFQGRIDMNDQLTGLRRDFIDPYATARSAYSQNRAAMVQEARGESAAAAAQALPDFAPPPPGTAPAPAAEPERP